jgi:hypothetical protein
MNNQLSTTAIVSLASGLRQWLEQQAEAQLQAERSEFAFGLQTPLDFSFKSPVGAGITE